MLLAADVFTKANLEKVLDIVLKWCMSVGKNILIALIILVVGSRVIKWVVKLIDRSIKKTSMEPMVGKFLLSFTKIGLNALLIVSVIGVLGIPTSSVIAAISAAGLAIGLALQGSLSNFAGGVLILIFKPFDIGDYIKEDTNGNEGTVVGIDLFYTKLKTSDNKRVVVPNGTLANSSLTNYTSQDMRRVDIVVGISYDSDIKLAKTILLDIINADERVLKDKDINVFVSELAESQVTLGTRFWVSTDDYWKTKWDMLELYKEKLEGNGVDIPYNQICVTINEK